MVICEKSKLSAALAQTTSDYDFQRILVMATTNSSQSASPLASIQEDEDADQEYDLDAPFLDLQPM